jgi:Ser/Thr protein kinase RdoA (MazF antagonist)
VQVIGSLGGGYRNEVLEIRSAGRRLLVRRSRRESASLDWELDLLPLLAEHGIRVPQVVPCLDGLRHVHGVVVQQWLDSSRIGSDTGP